MDEAGAARAIGPANPFGIVNLKELALLKFAAEPRELADRRPWQRKPDTVSSRCDAFVAVEPGATHAFDPRMLAVSRFIHEVSHTAGCLNGSRFKDTIYIAFACSPMNLVIHENLPGSAPPMASSLPRAPDALLWQCVGVLTTGEWTRSASAVRRSRLCREPRGGSDTENRRCDRGRPQWRTEEMSQREAGVGLL